MAKHLNLLEKEFLIRTYRSNQAVKINDFCEKNSVSVGAFKKWLKQYEEGGLEGLARADTDCNRISAYGRGYAVPVAAWRTFGAVFT